MEQTTPTRGEGTCFALRRVAIVFALVVFCMLIVVRALKVYCYVLTLRDVACSLTTCPPSSIPVAVNANATKTVFVSTDLAKSITITLSFVSSSFADDYLRLSRPVDYVQVAVASLDGKDHAVQVSNWHTVRSWEPCCMGILGYLSAYQANHQHPCANCQHLSIRQRCGCRFTLTGVQSTLSTRWTSPLSGRTSTPADWMAGRWAWRSR